MLTKRFAALDIGSNTVRLLIGERTAPDDFRPLSIKRRITRLAGNFTPTHGLDTAAIQRTLQAIEGLAETARKARVEAIWAAATGVLRKAPNRQAFLSGVKEKAGLAVRLLSGPQEGKLMWKGIRWMLKDRVRSRLAADMGGWSTEFIWAEEEIPKKVKSVNLGVVDLAERFLRHDPPSGPELLGLETHIRKVLCRVRDQMEREGLRIGRLDSRLIGTAGTMTTLAAMHLGLARYDAQKVSHHAIPKKEVGRLYREVSRLSKRERRKMQGLERGREDLIVAGAAGVLGILEVFELKRLMAIDSGLLEGILLDGLLRTPG